MTDYTPTTDWRQIDTSTPEGRRALDIEIARRLGKSVETSTEGNGPQFDQNREWVDEWYYEDGMIYEVPYYTLSHTAAFNLLLTSGAFWSMDGGGASNISGIRMYDNEFNDVREYGDTDKLALLICKAWLAFDDQRIEG